MAPSHAARSRAGDRVLPSDTRLGRRKSVRHRRSDRRFWVLIHEVPIGLIGYGARTGTFLGIGLIVGLQSQRRLKLEADRGRVIAEPQATAMRDRLTGRPNRRVRDDRFEPESSAPVGLDNRLSVRCLTSTGSSRAPRPWGMSRAIA